MYNANQALAAEHADLQTTQLVHLSADTVVADRGADRAEFFLPVFAAVLLALLLCAALPMSSEFSPPKNAEVAAAEPLPEVSPFSGISTNLFLEEGDNADPILEVYRNPAAQEQVIEFFSRLCGSRDTAAAILSNASLFHISPSLAFALCWEESRYKVTAVNRWNNDSSIDRGLFQLNNKTFPRLAEEDFFKPDLNAWYGMNHLRWCLDSGGSEIAALAMYNAGTGRVNSGGTPRRTLDYAARILKNRERIEIRFMETMQFFDTPAAALVSASGSLAVR